MESFDTDRMSKHLRNGLFFFERCSFITAKVYAYKLNNARYEHLFAHTVAVTRLHLLKKMNNPLLIFTFLKPFLQCIFNYILLLCIPYRFGV